MPTVLLFAQNVKLMFLLTLHSSFNCSEAIYVIDKQRVLEDRKNHVNLQVRILMKKSDVDINQQDLTVNIDQIHHFM